MFPIVILNENNLKEKLNLRQAPQKCYNYLCYVFVPKTFVSPLTILFQFQVKATKWLLDSHMVLQPLMIPRNVKSVTVLLFTVSKS